jgi:hypothetical protein
MTPDYRARKAALMQQQTDAFNRNAPMEEKVAILRDIQQVQAECRKAGEDS